MPEVDDPTAALVRSLRAILPSRGLAFEEVRSRSWASVTFAGARHEIALRLEGESAEAAADRLLARLDTTEFSLRGHILADIAIMSQERGPGRVRIRLEALTVEDF